MITDDYDLRDIQELLKREGSPLKSAQISVVLTRMKGRGEITEIGGAAGPHPALFRRPETGMIAPAETVDFVTGVEIAAVTEAAA